MLTQAFAATRRARHCNSSNAATASWVRRDRKRRPTGARVEGQETIRKRCKFSHAGISGRHALSLPTQAQQTQRRLGAGCGAQEHTLNTQLFGTTPRAGSIPLSESTSLARASQRRQPAPPSTSRRAPPREQGTTGANGLCCCGGRRSGASANNFTNSRFLASGAWCALSRRAYLSRE